MSEADFIVTKTNLPEARWLERPTRALEAGEVRLGIEAVALTANNVTYAAFADFAGYWNFFPAAEDDVGRVPFWGFAKVIESKADGVEVGSRFYGYYPASTDLIVKPIKTNPNGFTDGSAHRKDLPGFYNIYHAIATDPAYDPAYEAVQMIVRPLYATGWLIDDCLMEREAPPSHVIVSSASAKTSLAYASAARKRDGLVVTGLTSAGNRAFTEETGLYDHVVTYDDMDSLSDAGSAIHVDIRGNPAMRGPLAEALKGQLTTHLQVGATNWDATRSPDLPTASAPNVPNAGSIANEVFFAPGHAETCAKRMGGGNMATAMNTDMRAFYPVMSNMLTIRDIPAKSDLVSEWQAAVSGDMNPAEGMIVRF